MSRWGKHLDTMLKKLGWEGISPYSRWDYAPMHSGSAEMKALLDEIKREYQAVLETELRNLPRKEAK